MTDTQDFTPDAGESGAGAAEAASSAPRRKSGGGLNSKVLAELQQIASGLGIKGAGRMRKSALIEAIQAAQSSQPGESAASADAPATLPLDGGAGKSAGGDQAAGGGKSATDHEPASREKADGAKSADADKATDADKPRRNNKSGDSKPKKKVAPGKGDAASSQPAESEQQSDAATTGDVAESGRAKQDDAPDDRSRAKKRDDGQGQGQGGKSRRDSNERDESAGRDDSDGGDQRGGKNRRDDGRNRGNQQREDNRGRGGSDDQGGGKDRRDDGRNRDNQQRDDNRGRDGSGGDDDQNRNEPGGRRRRSRNRNRNRDRGGRGSESEPTVSEDDVLIPAAGILDVLDNYAFVRTSGYLPGPNDVYVSLSMVRKWGLRKGDAIVGQVRQTREGERKEKFNPLVKIESINGMEVDDAKKRIEFPKLTPLYASERLRLETDPATYTTRIIDIVAPIGKGQRGLIVSPSKAGKTLIMQAIANAITTNNPECHLMVVLVDERPEEVTEMQRAVNGEVIASTFDRPADDHTTVAELAIERAKRLVEMGHDVVVLLDSITRLGRAYNLAAPASGRILSGGVDSSALYPPKKFFGAARNIEDGGSLTILATALIETGSKMDEVIFEEFKGTGNMELRLRREFADKRIFPAIDVDASGTRREELLMTNDELQIVWKLRRVLSGLDGQQALELLLEQLKKAQTNIEFLMQVNKTTPTAPNRRTNGGE